MNFSNLKAQLILNPDTAVCDSASFLLQASPSTLGNTINYLVQIEPLVIDSMGGTPIPQPMLGSWDDGVTGAIPIGFDFEFIGNTYSDCYIGTNGWITFSQPLASYTTYTPDTIPSTAMNIPKNCIFGIWKDLHPGYGVGPYVFYKTVGTAPNRRFMVNWQYCPLFACTTTYDKFQIVLHETTNEMTVNIYFQNICYTWAGGLACQGLHNYNGTAAVTVPDRNATQWSATNETVRFIPYSVPNDSVKWYDTLGNLIGTGEFLNVSVQQTSSFIAEHSSLGGYLLDTFTCTVYHNDFAVFSEVHDIVCAGDSNGIIELYAEGCGSPFSYNWSNSETTPSIYNLSGGDYILTVTNSYGDFLIDSFYIVEPDTFWMLGIVADADSGFNSGGVEVLLFGGFPPYESFWSNGQHVLSNPTNANLYSVNSGTYSVTVIDSNSCIIEKEFVVGGPSPNWSYIVTSNSHNITIPSKTNITINGNSIEYGDMVGVFYDSAGTMACAGYTVCTYYTDEITAYGAEPGNDAGFLSGEAFTYRIWRYSDSSVFDAYVTSYLGSVQYPDYGIFVNSGESYAQTLMTYNTSQNISFSPGWNIYSTYIELANMEIANMFSALSGNGNLEIVKNEDGNIYWPAYGINSIGKTKVGEAFQIKLNTGVNYLLQGAKLVPESTPIQLHYGWNLMGYLRDNAGNAEQMLQSISQNIQIVKNDQGQIYWPQFNINSIGNMLPGEGYQIKMSQAATLYYPAN